MDDDFWIAIMVGYGAMALGFTWVLWRIWHLTSMRWKTRRDVFITRAIVAFLSPAYLGFGTLIATRSPLDAVVAFQYTAPIAVPLGLWLMMTRWPAFLVPPVVRRGAEKSWY
jgi:hypothetical protein